MVGREERRGKRETNRWLGKGERMRGKGDGGRE